MPRASTIRASGIVLSTTTDHLWNGTIDAADVCTSWSYQHANRWHHSHDGIDQLWPSAALSGAFWGWIFPISAPSVRHLCTICAPRGLDYLRIIVGIGADGING